MRFVSSSGVLQKARRYPSGASGVSEAEVKDEKKLAEILRKLSARVTDLEALTPPEAIEFEVNVGSSGALTSIAHNLSSQIRWYVVTWIQKDGISYPVKAPMLVQDATSDTNTLVLRSYAAGRAIIRVEPAFAGIDPGAIVSASPDDVRISLSQNFTTTSVAAGGVSTGLAFSVSANEVWRIHYVGGAGNNDAGAGGCKYAIGAPTGATVDAWHYSSTVNMPTRAYAQIAAINTLGAAVHTVNGGERDDQIIGVVKIGATAGTVSINVASVTAATTTTVYAMSSLAAYKVTEV